VGLLHETLLPIQADHRAMCRFSDSASQKYRVVEEAILGLISAATAKEEHETDIDGALPPRFYLPSLSPRRRSCSTLMQVFFSQSVAVRH